MLSDLVVCYLFLGGAGAGACFVACLLSLLVPAHQLRFEGGRRCEGVVSAPYRAFLAPAFLISAGVLLLAVVCLAADLGRPDRMLAIIANPRATHITVGAITLVASCAIVIANAIVWAGLWRRPSRAALRAFAVVGVIVSGVAFSYTGLLLQSVSAVPLWHSWALPAAFALSSLSSGAAIVAGAAAVNGVLRTFSATIRRIAAFDMMIIVLEAVFVAVVIVSASHAAGVDCATIVSSGASKAFGEGGPASATALAAAESVHRILTGPVGAAFWSCFALMGIVAAFMLDGAVAVFRVEHRGAVLLAAFCVLVGAFALRYCIVVAGVQPTATTLFGVG